MSDLTSIFPFSARHVGVVEHGYEDAPIVGRIRRGSPDAPGKERASEMAKEKSWWRRGLVLDSRDAKWWVWRMRA